MNNSKKMENKRISNTTEASLEGLLNNHSQQNVSHATTNLYFSEKDFDFYVNNIIKTEKYSLYHDELYDLEYSTDIASKIVSSHTSSPSTALPIMKTLSSKSEPHTCLECCFKCNNIFRLLDSPLHIRRIRSIDKKNEFLKIDPSLCVDSCLCEFCWKDLEKTYKSNKSKNRKEESYSEKKDRLIERYAKKNVPKNQNQARKCSINSCSRSDCQKMTVNECENIKNLFLTLIEYCRLLHVQSTKQTTDFLKFPFRLCKIHRDMFLVMSTCQICGDKLNAPFNTDDWLMYEVWNLVLIENHLPLILKPGMFICVTCKGHVSKINPGFPTNDLPRLQKYILKSNSICLKLYGEPQKNLFNICKGSTYLASPDVFPNTKEESVRVCLTKVEFSDSLITTYYNYEKEMDKNDTKSITSTALGLDIVKLEEECFKTHDNLLQNVCQVDKVEIVENKPGIINSCQVINEQKSIENNQSKIHSHEICSDAQDRSSMDLKGANQSVNEINTIHKTVYLNETDNSMNSFIAALEPPNAIVNPVSIKRKESNLICHTISNEDVKKQRLNGKYSFYENNSIYDNTTKSYKYINIAHPSINSPSILNMNSNCKNKYDSNVASDDDLSLDLNSEFIKSKFEIKPDHKIEMDCKIVSNSEKSQDGKIILNGEDLLENYTTYLESVKESNCEMVLDAKTKPNSEKKSNINISVTEEFHKKLSTFKIVSNIRKGLDDEILLDGDKIFETASWSEKGTIKYKIISDDEITPSGNQGSTCIIISDNDEEFNNKLFSTYKINVQKGSHSKVLLNGEKVNILSESENRKAIYEIDPSADKKSICIIIFDNEKEFINKKLSTHKIISNVEKESDCEILLDCEKVYDIESDSENGKIKYMIVSKNIIKSSGNQRSQCTIISDNEDKFNNKKSTFKILVKNVQKGSHPALMDGEKSREMLSDNEDGRIKCIIVSNNVEELNYKKVSDIKIVPNSNILVDDSQGLKPLDVMDNNYFTCI